MSHTRKRIRSAISGRWAIAAAIAAILVVTLRPTGPGVAPAFDWCIGCSEYGTLDLLYNLALFVPLGVVLGLRGSGVAQVLALSAALSASIEILQLVAVPGRDPALSDVVANSLGGALGVPLARARAFLGTASRTAWRVVVWSWVALTLGILAFGTWAVAASVPRGDYFVQWLPLRPLYSPFAGALHAFNANGVELPAAARLSPAQLAAGFVNGDFDVTARVTPGPRREGISLIARVALEYGEFLMLGRQHDAFVVRYRSNALLVGSRSPIYALAGAFRGDPHGSVEVRVIKRGDSLQLRATRPGVAPAGATRHLRITAARLWATLLPFDRGFGDAGVLGDVLWLALLVAPATYAATRAHAGAWRLLPLVAQATGVALIAVVMQPSLWWWPLWLGVAAGAVAGYWLGSRALVNATEGV